MRKTFDFLLHLCGLNVKHCLSEDDDPEKGEKEVATPSKLDRLRLIGGEFCLGQEMLRDKPDRSFWILLKLADAILRGISQVCFANNPISGLLALVGIGLAGYEIALGAVLGPFVAILTCLLLDQPRAKIENGLFQFNACLVGCVIASLYPFLYKGDLGAFTWVVIVVMSAISVPLQSSLSNVLSAFSADFPVTSTDPSKVTPFEKRALVGLTFSFNAVATVAFFCLVSYKDEFRMKQGMMDKKEEEEVVDWLLVFRGILLSSGQVYAAYSVVGSVLIYLGLALYSPRLALVSLVGAAVGSFTALLFTSFPYAMIYDGLWGYCPFLTFGALGHTFYRPSWRAAVLATLACLFTAGLQAFMAQTVATIGVPTLTYPFVLTTWGVMLLNSENHLLVRS